MQRLDDEHEKNLLGAIDYDNTIQWAKYFQRMATTPEAFEGQDHPVGFAVVLVLVAKGLPQGRKNLYKTFFRPFLGQ